MNNCTYCLLHANFVCGGGGGGGGGFGDGGGGFGDGGGGFGDGGDGEPEHANFEVTSTSNTKVRVSPLTVKVGSSADGSHVTERTV